MKKKTTPRKPTFPQPAPAPKARPRMVATIAPPDALVTNAREFLAEQIQKIVVDERLTVRVQRIDMLTLLFEGWMPLPLMQGVQRLIGSYKAGNDTAVARGFMSMPEQDRAAMVNMLQRFVVKAVVEPIFVLEDDKNPDHIPVNYLTFEQLTTIWTAIRPAGTEVPPEEADRFRGGAATRVDAAAHRGQDLQPQPELVAPPVERDVITS